MLKTFPIEFIRQTFVQKLLEAHNENPNYYGGNDQVNILSFYEQLKSQEEVDRFVNTFRDLTKQQNRSDLILNGVLVSPENPTITNLYSCLIVPMTWTCSLRTLLANRDQSIDTINNLIYNLKGKKVDIAQLECEDENGKKFYEPFVVGTIGQNDGVPQLKNGDYIGEFDDLSKIDNKMQELLANGVRIDYSKPLTLYVKDENYSKLIVVKGHSVDYIGNNYVEYEDFSITSSHLNGTTLNINIRLILNENYLENNFLLNNALVGFSFTQDSVDRTGQGTPNFLNSGKYNGKLALYFNLAYDTESSEAVSNIVVNSVSLRTKKFVFTKFEEEKEYLELEDFNNTDVTYDTHGNETTVSCIATFTSAQNGYVSIPNFRNRCTLNIGVVGENDYDELLKEEAEIDMESLTITELGYIAGTCRYSFKVPNSVLPIESWIDDVEEQPRLILLPYEYKEIATPIEHVNFEKYKVSFSCEAIRCDEPRNLNENEYCDLTFSGSATLVNESVKLGNDLVKLGLRKKMIKSSPNINITDICYWLEPLELPSGNNADTKLNQLLSNKFIINTHTNALSINMQYTFIIDSSIELINQIWKYARYGKQGTSSQSYLDGITPNMIYTCKEFWSSWGNTNIEDFLAKIVESIDSENTESDTMTITVPLQVQGEN